MAYTCDTLLLDLVRMYKECVHFFTVQFHLRRFQDFKSEVWLLLTAMFLNSDPRLGGPSAIHPQWKHTCKILKYIPNEKYLPKKLHLQINELKWTLYLHLVVDD